MWQTRRRRMMGDDDAAAEVPSLGEVLRVVEEEAAGVPLVAVLVHAPWSLRAQGMRRERREAVELLRERCAPACLLQCVADCDDGGGCGGGGGGREEDNDDEEEEEDQDGGGGDAELLVRWGCRTLPALVCFARGERLPVQNLTPRELKDGTALAQRAKTSFEDHPEMSSETTVHCLQRLPRGICAATGSCPLLFVSGDRSSVGKSSICLGLLASFMEQGIRPEKLAYIKPVTQCEAEQPVTRFCAQHGIQCVGLGPVVFYKGFTREFLAGNVGTSAELLEDAAAAVQQVARGKHLVLVDGVGYPAVGSICGISNADVAARLNAPVLLVGKPGVGDAVDSFNLNASFFESRNVRVLGVVYNKFEVDGYYSLDKCEPAIRSYFDQYRRQTRVYGFLPKMEVQAPDDASDADRDALFRSQFTRLFVDIFDIDRLAVDMLHDVCMKRLATVCAGAGIQRTLQQTVPMTLAATQTPVESNTTAVATAAAAATTAAAAASPSFPSSSSVSATDAAAAAAASVAVAQRIPRRKATVSSTANGASPVAPPNKRRRTRADIEAVARAQGARAGG